MLNEVGINEPGHLSDEDLLLFAEGELSRVKADQARRHLLSCQDCQLRGSALEDTFSEIARFQGAKLDSKIPSGAGPRALLKAHLDAIALANAKPWWSRFAVGTSARGQAYLCAVLGVVILCVAARFRPSNIRNHQLVSTYLEARPVPNSNLTPGATRPVRLADICSQRESDLDPTVSPSVQKIVFTEYGIADAPSKDYQVDYLINPQLGGTDDIRNLWPQPYGTTVWNARAKDALEGRLYQMVCEKQIDLASAQHDIATDWISAYKKYFHTSEPV
jgi:hypothetical protein